MFMMQDLTSIKDIKEICRTCINQENITLNIKDTHINLDNLSVPVMEILNLFAEVKLNEYLPDKICSKCLEQAINICKFKTQVRESELLLKKYLEDKENRKTGAQANNGDKSECVGEHKACVKEESSTNENDAVGKGDSDKCQEVKEEPFENILEENERTTVKKSKKKTQTIKEGTKRKNLKISGDDAAIIEPLVCTLCNKSFKTKYILQVHLKRHKYKGQFLCTLCGKGFNSQGCLNRHTRVHTGEKKYKCEICQKRFPSSNNLNLHIRTHTGVKPYLCTTCGKSFSNRTGLNFHIKTHTKEKPYVCDICGKSFGAQSHIEWHRMIHTGERPFPCSKCDKAFIKKVDLQRHEIIHAGLKPFPCCYCPKAFRTKMHLNYHIMIHTEERPHRCSVCGKGFIRRYYLKDHILKQHGSLEGTCFDDNADDK